MKFICRENLLSSQFPALLTELFLVKFWVFGLWQHQRWKNFVDVFYNCNPLSIRTEKNSRTSHSPLVQIFNVACGSRTFSFDFIFKFWFFFVIEGNLSSTFITSLVNKFFLYTKK